MASREYLINVSLAILLAILAWAVFFVFFGASYAILASIIVLGIPHFFLAALADFARLSQKYILPFIIATGLTILIALFLKSLNPAVALALYFGYFLVHLFRDELMFEETVTKNNYREMTSSWPQVSDYSIVLTAPLIAILLGIQITGKPLLAIPQSAGILIFAFLGVLWIVLLFKKGIGNKLPIGVAGLLLLLGIVSFASGFQKDTIATQLRVIIVFYHFFAWYVFYTKRLLRKPKVVGNLHLNWRSILFSFSKSPRLFWAYVLVIQLITFGFFALYLFTPHKVWTQYFFGPEYWSVWVIWHITVSFVAKWPMPNFAFKLFWPAKVKSASFVT